LPAWPVPAIATSLSRLEFDIIKGLDLGADQGP
jgi:hypothetical protein